MKPRLLIAALFAAIVTCFAACNDDDDKDIKHNNVPEAYTKALQAKYPDAVNVKWEKTGRYYIAEFSKPQQEYDVWFAPEAQWAMTEIDYGRNLFFLPAEVNKSFAESEYGINHTIDDVSMYERTDRTFYVIEVEPTGGGADTYLYYAPDGENLKITTQDIEITPETVI